MQCIIEGQAVNYYEEGKGPILLIVHGWKNNVSHFRPLASKLSSKYRIVAVDLPGFGGSSANRGYTIDDYAEFLAKFVDKINIDKLTGLIGHSMGGQISVVAVARGLLKPKNLVLLSSAGIRNKSKLKKRALRLTAKPLRKLVPDKVKDRFYKKIESDYSSRLSEIEKAILDSVLARDVQLDAKQITQPTLLVYGVEDTSTPPTDGEIFRKLIKNSQLELINGAGHQLHTENTEQIANMIESFVK